MRDDAPIQTESGSKDPVGSAASEVEGGSALPPETPPPPLNFRILSDFWLFVSAGALLLLIRDPAWRKAPDLWTGLGAVSVEQWLALLLLAVQGWLFWRARQSGKRRIAKDGP